MRPDSPPLATVCGSRSLVTADRSGVVSTNRGSCRQLGSRRVSSAPLGRRIDGSILMTFPLAAAAWTGSPPAGLLLTQPVPTAAPQEVDDERFQLVPRRGWEAATTGADRDTREVATDRRPEA